jgi:hypothetical protein
MGRANSHDNLVRLAEELELADCVTASHKYVPVSELPALIANADGVVPLSP